jgi:DNA-binding transcriptional regulator YiaG
MAHAPRKTERRGTPKGAKLRAGSQHLGAYSAISATLRNIRKEAELTQQELAAKLGFSVSIISKCETHERRIDALELIRWARACGVEPAEAMRRMEQR